SSTINRGDASRNEEHAHAQATIEVASQSAQRQVATALANGFAHVRLQMAPFARNSTSPQPTVSGIVNPIAQEANNNENDDAILFKSEINSDDECQSEGESVYDEIKEEVQQAEVSPSC